MNIEMFLENYSVSLNTSRFMLARSKGHRANPRGRAVKSADGDCLNIYVQEWDTGSLFKGRSRVESEREG